MACVGCFYRLISVFYRLNIFKFEHFLAKKDEEIKDLYFSTRMIAGSLKKAVFRLSCCEIKFKT